MWRPDDWKAPIKGGDIMKGYVKKKRYVTKSLLLNRIDAVMRLIWERLDEEHKKGLTPPPPHP